ncbi:hypothetical protein NPIL_585351 [Nephila pilipes]|uniref:Uncharacterized protein n=1 Tax=Nephila pilipes TaxID=299642 RepID=A0A8X6PIZ1_NEPPI|nr:hypothetical protein NPIL_585351 [Nephila pilipes]
MRCRLHQNLTISSHEQSQEERITRSILTGQDQKSCEKAGKHIFQRKNFNNGKLSASRRVSRSSADAAALEVEARTHRFSNHTLRSPYVSAAPEV